MALAVTTPHLAFPLQLTPDGTQLVVNEQDSAAEILQGCALIAAFDISVREDRTDFGWEYPDMTLIPVSPAGLVNAINRLEPRAQATAQPDGTPLALQAAGTDELTIYIQIPNTDTSGAGLLQT